jgi:hypothetical protein
MSKEQEQQMRALYQRLTDEQQIKVIHLLLLMQEDAPEPTK